MRALCLREVNLPGGRSGEEQADECIAENAGDLADGLIERGIAIAHERSPSEDHPRTISAPRSKRRLVDGIDTAFCRVR
jgi:hypothetical protein